MKTAGSIKVVRDLAGNPQLVVGTPDGGYEVQTVLVTGRAQFAAARRRLLEYDTACADGTLENAHRWLGRLSEQLRLVLDAVDETFDGYPLPPDDLLTRSDESIASFHAWAATPPSDPSFVDDATTAATAWAEPGTTAGTRR